MAALAGLRTGRILPTLVLTVASWPATLIAAFVSVNLLAVPLVALTGSAPPAGGGSFADDYALADAFGWAATVLLSLAVVALVLLARGFGARAIR